MILVQKKHFAVTGMTCSACSSRVEKSVAALAGVQEVAVNLLKNSMVVSFDENTVSAEKIIAAVEKAGYGAALQQPAGVPAQAAQAGGGADAAAKAYQAMKRRLIISIIFAVPLFYISMGHMMGAPLPSFLMGNENALPFAFTQFLLLLPIVFVNFKYYSIGYKTLFHLSPNMDSLIAIGSSAAIVYGVYAIYKIGWALGRADMMTVHMFSMDLYFESAGMILTLITLGKFFESRAKGKTSDAITKLMNLAPKTAVREKDGAEEKVPVEEVQPGDVLIVRAGESIPLDGVLSEGRGVVDESALTGEPIPVEKQQGSSVIGGTINKSGYFKMQVTKTGADTTLAQIVNLVDEATSSKAPIAKIADKVSGVFVPVVITIAVLTTIGWLIMGESLEFALSIGICVLVISCPCALGLATPTAIMVGTGKGASSGILIKSAEALENAHSINTVVLDKTGTITKGKPVVTDIAVMGGRKPQEVLSIAYSLEKLSEHPLAEAVCNEAAKQGIKPSEVADFKQIPGRGLSGIINSTLYLAGNKRLLDDYGLGDKAAAKLGEEFAEQGKTPLFFASESELLGIIAVADVIKATSPQAVAQLQSMGIDVVMLTGDNAKTAQAIGRQAGISHVVSDVLPQDKEAQIRKIQSEGKKVAMVGDGINDAPALARADVGIAIGAGTDIAIDSADIVLMKSDLTDVASTIRLSKAVIRNIRQNLFWAFIYNIIGIPIAMGLFYTAFGLKLNPMIGALAMSFSSVFVVSNALRLRFFKTGSQGAAAAQDEVKNDEVNLIQVNTDDKGEFSMGLLGKLFSHEEKQPAGAEKVLSKVLSIEGMMCQHCVAHVTKALQGVEGVSGVKVDLDSKSAEVTADASVSDDALKQAVKDAGYEVTAITAGNGGAVKKVLSIEGMMCQHCVAHVTKALQGVEGVSGVKVDLDSKSAEVTADASVSDDALKQAVKDAGYEVTAIK